MWGVKPHIFVIVTADIDYTTESFFAQASFAESSFAETSFAESYANALLRDVGMSRHAQCSAIHPALRNAQCGLNALTGRADAPAQLCPVPLAACADGVLAALRAISDKPALRTLDGAALLGERAACFGHTRAGAVSAGGSCRLLPAANGWLAINLARASDWDLVPAWLQTEIPYDWQSLATALKNIAVDAAVTRGRLLGLAVCAMTPAESQARSWYQQRIVVSKQDININSTRINSSPLIVDLSSLWAGPLCGHLLQALGARVIKVESSQRPDGARLGPKNFFDLLNANKECVALNLTATEGREQLRQLLLRADIVIEASRPRALRQMNIVAEDIIAQNPALTWLSITGYGRDEPQANWIAFGDDAGVAAGLSQLLFDATGETLFCGDAIADPLTGMHAALAAWTGYLRGGGELISLSLRDVVAHCIRVGCEFDARSVRERYRDWMAVLKKSGVQAAAPITRVPSTAAHALGADTQAVLAEFGIAC